MKRIFLVDDDQQTRGLVRRELTQREFEIHDFESPTEALAAILADPPDLLISAVDMSGMTGIDLATTVRREADSGLPVILVTSSPSTEVTTRAQMLGIRHVVEACTDEIAELAAAVRRELFWIEAADTVRRLDDLRMEFLVDLSHQLRTPMTAMKLAVDGLCSDLYAVMNPSQHSMAKITCRNIDRVVTLMENQLDLLRMMTGEKPLCRRLVDLDRLLRALPRRLFDTEAEHPAVVTRRGGNGSGVASPLYVFTDPELVSTLVDYVLDVGPPNSRRTIHLDYDPVEQSCRLDVGVDFGCSVAVPENPVVTPPDERKSAFTPDFEYRAYRTLIGALGGDFEMEKDENHKWVRFQLPRYPLYSREKDFLEPVRNLRPSNGENDGLSQVHFVKCDLGERAERDYLAAEDPVVRGFVDRVTSIVSEGDAVIRSKQHGTIYLALLGRSDHELDHVVRFLAGECGDGSRENGGGKPYVWKPQTIVADQREIDGLVRGLELV